MVAKCRQCQPRVSDEVTAVVGLQVSDADSRQVPAGRGAGVVVPDRQTTDAAQRPVTSDDEHIM